MRKSIYWRQWLFMLGLRGVLSVEMLNLSLFGVRQDSFDIMLATLQLLFMALKLLVVLRLLLLCLQLLLMLGLEFLMSIHLLLMNFKVIMDLQWLMSLHILM